MRFFCLIAAIFVVTSAIPFVPYQPGLVPDLYKEVSHLPGGWRKVDLRNELAVLEMKRLIRESLADLQRTNPLISPRVEMTEIQQAIKQIGRGVNYKIVFSAKKESFSTMRPIIELGQCYFKLHVPFKSGMNAHAEVTKYVCEKLAPDDDDSSEEKDDQ